MDSIEYYNKYAAKVFEDTVEQNLEDIRKEGRDSLAFYEAGFDVTPLDASEEMCKLAEIHTGLEVLEMTYEDMDFESVFDGVWACASLVHVPKKELQDILSKISTALKDGGIFYMSVKKGDFEGFRGERYFSDYTADAAEIAVEESGRFQIMKVWETEDVRSGHGETVWINVLARKK